MSFEEAKKLLMEAMRIMADAKAPTSNNSSSQGQGTKKTKCWGLQQTREQWSTPI